MLSLVSDIREFVAAIKFVYLSIGVCESNISLFVSLWVQDATAEDATAVDTTAEDGTAEDATAELLKKGWTLRRSHKNPATHITMDATAEIRRNPCSIMMFL